MKRSYGLLSIPAMIAAATLAPSAAHAAVFTIDCGSGGATTALQTQINSIGSNPGDQINVLGTCNGSVVVSNADRLTISGLSLTGVLSTTNSKSVRFTNLSVNGSLQLVNSRNSSLVNVKMLGDTIITRGSQVTFSTLDAAPWSDADGTHDSTFNCVGQSECSLFAATLTGSNTSNTSVGLNIGSEARLNLYAGSISGYGIGVQAWNNSVAFIQSQCDPITISGNRVTGVYAEDGGTVKVYGTSAADAALYECPSSAAVLVDITSNGKYGVLADGGGNAYLHFTRMTGHTLDGVRVQHGSVVRVRSSQIGAGTSSGRAARVKALSHLYFDEQEAGPAAGSTLSGPVCVTTSSYADAENSSTALTIVRSCPGP